MGTGSGIEWASARLPWPVTAGMADPGLALGQVVERASWSGFDRWWSKVAGVGFCARPIHLVGVDETGREHTVLARCKNRRASVCPSCSDLYAADTWQLVTAGVIGGRHSMPATVAWHPAVFVTLTAPSFGPVHGVRTGASGGARRCQRPVRVASTPSYRRCVHGKPLWCNVIHHNENSPRDVVGQPLCVDCYDYLGHVLFSWWAPELWRRFTIAVRRVLRSELRRRGEDPDKVAVSFVKVVELQARGIPHYHAVIRLDATPTERDEAVAAPVTSITATELAAAAQIAAGQVRLTVAYADGGSRVLRFGEQVDTQPLTSDPAPSGASGPTGGDQGGAARRVASYLPKYVTKSVGEFGLSLSRMSPEAVEVLDVCPHVRAILTTLVSLAASGARYAPMLAWLHTLGYRGHITTKSRRFSVTLTALRARREAWRTDHAGYIPAGLLIGEPDDLPAVATGAADTDGPLQMGTEWSFARMGHVCAADYYRAVSAAVRAREYRRLARDAYRDDLAAA